MILDAECRRPIHTACNMVEPSAECQLVLRHFFNDSGVYCINVSMANDVSLAAASAKVSVDMGKAHMTLCTLSFDRFEECAFLLLHNVVFCFRFRSVLSWHHRHGFGCPGAHSSHRNSGIFLQVGTDFFYQYTSHFITFYVINYVIFYI